MAKTILLLCLALSAASAQPADPKPPAKKGLTLTYTGKTEFVTDEGTWISVDISKNGETILFDLLGDLYTLPIAGGVAKRITEGPAYDSQPSFSPDSNLIAFVSDRDGADNLWIAKADGSAARQLTHEREAELASPVWTPDGEYVVISRQAAGARTYELWMTTYMAAPAFRSRKLKLERAPRQRPSPELRPHLVSTSWEPRPPATANIFTTPKGPAASNTTPLSRCGKWHAAIALPVKKMSSQARTEAAFALSSLLTD